eukprot:3540557-Amphidinium_carterae.2
MAYNMSKVTTTPERHDSRFQELERRLFALESRLVAKPVGIGRGCTPLQDGATAGRSRRGC